MVSIHHRESNKNVSSNTKTKISLDTLQGVLGHGRQHILFTNCDKVVVLKLEHYELVRLFLVVFDVFVLCFVLM